MLKLSSWGAHHGEYHKFLLWYLLVLFMNFRFWQPEKICYLLTDCINLWWFSMKLSKSNQMKEKDHSTWKNIEGVFYAQYISISPQSANVRASKLPWFVTIYSSSITLYFCPTKSSLPTSEKEGKLELDRSISLTK